MISTFINTRILKNRIQSLLIRSETNEARVPNGTTTTTTMTTTTTTTTTTTENKDMPIEIENPFKKERRVCILCELNIEPDYKNVRLLSQFQSRYTGRIYGKHITGLCEHKQKRVEEEIVKAQACGLMGYMTKDPKFVNDPMLFNPNTPFRPHKY